MELNGIEKPNLDSSQTSRPHGRKRLKYPELAHLTPVEYRRHYQNVRKREKKEASNAASAAQVAPKPEPEPLPLPPPPPPSPKTPPKKRGRKPTLCLTQGEGCVERMKEYKHNYYKEHPDIWKAQMEKKKEDPEKAAKIREYHRNYYQANKEKYQKKKRLGD